MRLWPLTRCPLCRMKEGKRGTHFNKALIRHCALAHVLIDFAISNKHTRIMDFLHGLNGVVSTLGGQAWIIWLFKDLLNSKSFLKRGGSGPTCLIKAKIRKIQYQKIQNWTILFLLDLQLFWVERFWLQVLEDQFSSCVSWNYYIRPTRLFS